MSWYCARCGARAELAGACSRDRDPLRAVEGVLGRTAGNYTLVGHVGEGGMGEVFRAVNPTIEAEVAVKVLHAQTNTGRDASRFLLEARAVNRVKHDGVAKILDAGYMDIGRPYLVMELLDGESLAATLAKTRLGVERTMRVVDDVLAVVAAAHAADIVHRDLKPQNVFLTRSGRTLVLDFGVAKLLDSSTAITRTGAMVGTPAYMAPEQIQAGDIDVRTDIYAIGVMLYEMLVGERPFKGTSTFAIAQSHVNDPPPRLPPGLPRDLQNVLDTALAKRQADRYPSASAMRAALAAVRLEAEAPAKPGAKRWLAGIALGMVSAATALAVVLLANRGGSTATPDASVEETHRTAPIRPRDAALPIVDAAVAQTADAGPSKTDGSPLDIDLDSLPVFKKSAIERATAEYKQRLADRSLLEADMPLEQRSALGKARVNKDHEATLAALADLARSAEAITIDRWFVIGKLARIEAIFQLRKKNRDTRDHDAMTARFEQARVDLEREDFFNANAKLTKIDIDLGPWLTRPKPKPDRDDELLKPF